MDDQLKRLEDSRNLPGYRSIPIFKDGDIVDTEKGVRSVKWHAGAYLIDGRWINYYACVPLNKDGRPSNKRLGRYSLDHEFLETKITLHGQTT